MPRLFEGDDNVAVHANDTLVENSYFGSGHGASIGSLCDDWLRNVMAACSIACFGCRGAHEI